VNDPSFDPVALFGMYMKATGVPSLAPAAAEDPVLQGKSLGLVHGSSWISLWADYFGRQLLPGVRLVSVGNQGVQLNFMTAHHKGEPCPPQTNIDLFVRYAQDLTDLWPIDALMVTCSTMNRAADAVKSAMRERNVPVVQIDEPMMERAVETGGRILVVATHGPTVKSTQALLQETADRLGKRVAFAGATVEEAFACLGRGAIAEHNEHIARAIRESRAKDKIDSVVLAQLSMTVFKLTYPDCRSEFGMDVLTSGETGFERVGAILRGQREA